MKNAMQLKALIKNIAKDKHISAQLVMQNFMLERLLERISVSKYQQKFILKGGFLIAAMVGLDTRATMDMDATIKGWPVNEESVKKMFLDICEIDLQDDVTFEFKKIGEIREGDEYTGYRVSLSANFPPMAVPLKLDNGINIQFGGFAYSSDFILKRIKYNSRLGKYDRLFNNKITGKEIENVFKGFVDIANAIIENKYECVMSRGK